MTNKAALEAASKGVLPAIVPALPVGRAFQHYLPWEARFMRLPDHLPRNEAP